MSTLKWTSGRKDIVSRHGCKNQLANLPNCQNQLFAFCAGAIMADEVRKVLQQLLANISGLHCVLITDRDGVPVMTVHTDKAPELAMKPGFLSTFGLAIDQGSKLGLGKTKTLICSYSQYQVIQMNKLPLIVSFIASDTCNTGHILALEEQIEPVLSSLMLVVAET